MKIFTQKRGFTLVEILTSLLVLAIGLASVLAIVTRSTSMGTYACDRNNAAVLLPEAIADIEKYCLVTKTVAATNNQFYEGEFMDTMGIAPNLAGVVTNIYKDVYFTTDQAQGPKGAGTKKNDGFRLQDLAFKGSPPDPAHSNPSDPLYNPGSQNQCYWPFSVQYSRVMGMSPTVNAAPNKGGTNNNLSDLGGPAYRALFKLEPHPEWFNKNVYPWSQPNPDSAYAGIYVLTIAMYRDLDPQLKISQKKHLEQLTDPIVVYLRDKKEH